MSELKVEKISLGTSSENPSAAIHITRDDNTSNIVIEENIDGTGGGDIRFWKTRNGDDTVDGDYLGVIKWESEKGETPVALVCARTDASGHGSAKMQFNTKAAADSSYSTRMTIKGDGKVGIGTFTPELLFEVSDTQSTSFVGKFTNLSTNTNADCLRLKINGSTVGTNNCFVQMRDDGNAIGKIIGNGSGGVTYTNAFTGNHPSVTADSVDNLMVGLILSSTGEIWLRNETTVSTGLPKVSLSTIDNDKSVFGILSRIETSDDSDDYFYGGYHKSENVGENETPVVINSLGEGLVWVTNKNGEIQNGDFICSTDIPGHGGKQSDDLLHNYTVAKCVETIDWNSVSDTIDHNDETYKKYLVACTYHCG